MKNCIYVICFAITMSIGCTKEDIAQSLIDDSETTEIVENAAKTCQTCVSKNSQILPQYLCDNGDGTYTLDDTKTVRIKEYTLTGGLERLVGVLESGGFDCK